MMKVESMHANRLYILALHAAQKKLGNTAWPLLSPVIRRGLVAEEVLNLLAAQDEAMDGARLRALIDDLQLLVTDNDEVDPV